jgi:S-formylglutathione hydrolase FrmB
MSIVNVRFRSEALGKHTSFNVVLPDQATGPFPVLIQLHGFSDDSYSWLYNSRLAQHVAPYPLIVVLPDGGTSRYLNLPYHERFGLQNYEDLMIRDIPNEVQRLFPVRPGKWAIGGLSMGGFGALRLGLKYPDRFASIWAHSAGLRPLDDAFLSTLADPSDADVVHLARQAMASGQAPELALDCGVDDELIRYNREFHAALDGMGYPHTWNEHPGAHTWDYWDLHVQEALARHARVLGIDAATE